jgi:RHS repeat-associated protein
LAGLSVNNLYDNYLRRTTAQIKNGLTVLQGASFAYEGAGRLQTVTDASATAYTATYAYHPDSLLVNTLTFKQSGADRLITSRSFDKLNRLTLISSTSYGTSAATLPVRFGYQYNSANQRTRVTLGEGSYWIYPYDKLGQVISGKRYWSDGTPVAGQRFEYGFDDIGNRKTTGVGGDASGLGLRSATYTPNRLNQYTQRTVPDRVDILGIANPTAGVTVNGNTAYRKGEYFHHALYVPNSTAQYPEVTVVSQYGGGQTSTGKVYVPWATESYQHDGDGNLTLDGRWTYSWDGENRLVEMKRDVDQPSGARQKLVFEYDHQGRRIRKQFFTYSGGWVEQTDVIFLYDGWNLMGELDANASNAKVRTYIWGIDLSGSLQGAGGVGGLLKVTDYTSGTTHHFVAYDGNGNVAGLVDGSTGATTARYEYGPFGEPLRATGSMGKKNPLRFSTKFTDTESGLLYYGYRYYNPSTARWPSRDPIRDEGFNTSVSATGNSTSDAGRNANAFGSNDPVGEWDFLGLETLSQFKKRCERTAKLSCDRQGRFVANWEVVYDDSGWTSDGYQIIKWTRWVCRYKCGTCTKEEKDKRQAEKNRVCNQPRSCDNLNSVSDCPEILKRIWVNNACGKARARVIECFDGGDEPHIQERSRVTKCGKDCVQKFYELGCQRFGYKVVVQPGAF